MTISAIRRNGGRRMGCRIRDSDNRGSVYAYSLILAERRHPDRVAVRRDRNRAVLVRSVEPDTRLTKPVDHAWVWMPEPVPVARGDDGQARTDRGDEARAAAGLAAVVRDLED